MAGTSSARAGRQAHPSAGDGGAARAAYAAAAVALVSFVAVVNLVAPTATAASSSDVWSHAAALDEWSSDLLSPGHPHLAVDAPTVRYIPPYLPIAAAASLGGWSGTTSLAISAILATALFALVLYRFFRAWLPHEPWAPLAGLTLMLFGWGLASPWSGLLELRSLVAVAGYPSTWGFVAGVAMVVAAIRASAAPGYRWLALTGLLSAVALLSHPIAAAFGYSLALVVALDRGWRAFVKPALAAAAGVVVALAWPFFPLLAATQGVPGTGRLEAQFYSPGRVLAMVAPALIGTYALAALWIRGRRAITVGFGLMLAPWALNIALRFSLGDRFLIFAVFYLHLALVTWGLPKARLTEWGSAWARTLRAAGVVLVGAHLFLAVLDVGGVRLELGEVTALPNGGQSGLVSQLERIALEVPDDAVVMADSTTAYMLPAFAGSVAVLDREVYGVNGIEDRIRDGSEFFSADTSRQRRHQLLDAYRAEMVLFAPEANPALTDGLVALGTVVAETPFFTLVAVG